MCGTEKKENTLTKHFSSIVFPFRYDAAQLETEAFNTAFAGRNGQPLQLWLPDDLQSYHLKENVAAMLGIGAEKGTVGQVWKMNDALRRKLDLPQLTDAVRFAYRYRGKGAEAILCLKEIRLVLFTTGIGFLEIMVTCEGTAELVQDVNYFLCEVKSDENRLSFDRRVGAGETVTVDFTMLDLVAKLTESLGAVEDFDSRAGLRYIDNKPLVFSYLLMERFDRDFGKILFGLRTNFKESYQVPAEQYWLATAQGICHPFDNVYWGASLNGAVCCACKTKDEKTNEFFTNTFPNNLRQTYLTLFLLHQHQRFAIQDLQRRFATVDRGLDGDAAAVREAYKKVRSLLDDAITLKLKCMFRDPSSVEHINNVDQFVEETLHVREDLADLEQGVRQLETVAGEIRGRIEAQEAKQEKKKTLRKEWLVCLFAAIWGCVTFFEKAWDVLEKITGWDISFRSWLVVIPIVLTLLPLYKLLVEMHARRKELKKLEKESKKDK